MANELVKISIETQLNAPLNKVWSAWTRPESIIHWNFASEDWHCPNAESDFREGGKFVYRMEARDGSMGFDFSGRFVRIVPELQLEYLLDDHRKVWIDFSVEGTQTRVLEVFEAENTNSLELQQAGWQAILNNFKKYVESGS
jgi:uncharacterized protein YndB with AHSA1/START domain